MSKKIKKFLFNDNVKKSSSATIKMVSEQTQKMFMGASGLVQVTLIVLVILLITNTLGSTNNAYASRMDQDVRKDDTVRFKNVLVDSSGSLSNRDQNRSSNAAGYEGHFHRDGSSTSPMVLYENKGTGDAAIAFRSKAINWAVGVDYNGAAPTFNIARSTALSTTDVFSISNTDAVTITNTGTTVDGLTISMANVTTADMLSLNAGGNSLTGDGKFIHCHDDDTTVFAVGPLGSLLYRANTHSLAAAYTLTAADSGKIFLLTIATGVALTLPAPVDGLYYKFYVTIAPTTLWTIVADAAVIQGGATGAGGDIPAVNETTITVATDADPGDWVGLLSDGTSWFLTGRGVHAAYITLA